MNKRELVIEMSKEVGTQDAAQKALDSFMKHVSAALKSGDPVTLTGFGTFKTVDQKPRDGRNPQTGETIRIPGGRKARFTPGKRLKESVN
ncbi:MAG: HU family DNA-binding protein [Desulfobacteraceae bacterium]|nr:HU family DNA-binding protein [Desulfobacteraceae bacterium]